MSLLDTRDNGCERPQAGDELSAGYAARFVIVNESSNFALHDVSFQKFWDHQVTRELASPDRPPSVGYLVSCCLVTYAYSLPIHQSASCVRMNKSPCEPTTDELVISARELVAIRWYSGLAAKTNTSAFWLMT